MNFTNPDLYETLQEGEPLTYEFHGKTFSLPTIVVPEGSQLYRGDYKGPTTPANTVPAFFANRTSALVYTRTLKNAGLTSYTVKRPIRLLHLNLNSAKDFYFHPRVSEEDRSYIRMWYKADIPAVVPVLPLGKPDAEGHMPYLNRRIAEIVCRMGLDGWIVLPWNPAKRRGLLDFSILRKQTREYTPEVMLCRWKECMTQTGGGRCRKHPYPWSAKALARSPFRTRKGVHRRGFTARSSLKSMGRLARSNGCFVIGDKYKNLFTNK